MLLKYAVKQERALAEQMAEVFRETVHFQRTHEEHLTRLRDLVWDSLAYTTGPRWLRSYLQGYAQACFDSLYACGLNGEKPSLVWVLVGPDGKRYGPNNEDWLRETDWYKANMGGWHVWRKAWENGGEWKVWSGSNKARSEPYRAR